MTTKLILCHKKIFNRIIILFIISISTFFDSYSGSLINSDGDLSYVTENGIVAKNVWIDDNKDEIEELYRIDENDLLLRIILIIREK